MLLSFDLAGAEFWVTSFLCRDEAMLNMARQSPRPSPHPITASRISGVPIDLIVQEHKLLGNMTDPLQIQTLRKEQLPEILHANFLPRTMSLRQMGKKSNHSLNYRVGYRTFALVNELDEREAKRIIELYRGKAYPGLNRWYEEIDNQIRTTRTMENCFGRKIYFQGALNDDLFRAATAVVPQSSVFDVCGEAMEKYMNDDSELFEPAQLLAQIHDSLTFDFRSSDMGAAAAFAIKLGLDYLSPTLCYHGESYVLDVSMKVGPTWGSLREVTLTPDAAVLAKALQKPD